MIGSGIDQQQDSLVQHVQQAKNCTSCSGEDSRYASSFEMWLSKQCRQTAYPGIITHDSNGILQANQPLFSSMDDPASSKWKEAGIHYQLFCVPLSGLSSSGANSPARVSGSDSSVDLSLSSSSILSQAKYRLSR